MRFCYGAIYYRKPYYVNDYRNIFNMTHFYSTNHSGYFDNPVIAISNSNFNYMNFGTNTSAMQLYNLFDFQHPEAFIYGSTRLKI